MKGLTALWNAAAAIDPTIDFHPGCLPALRRKRVRARRFTRRQLFEGMSQGRVGLFSGLNVLRPPYAARPRESLVRALLDGFPDSDTVSVQVGPSRQRRRLTVRELVERWERGRALVSVTDLHIRDTCLERIIDTQRLSDFNLLCCGSPDMARQEMMTMVVSSRANLTDSHSDDPDGSNHCFLGSKLWLAWETFEGLAHGLQDVERNSVADRAAFSLDVFLSLRSSRWFVVSQGLTLFLPGHLTHKVITLEPYLGVGSFYVALPNCVRTIARWKEHGPLWSIDDRGQENGRLVAEIAAAAAAGIRRLRNEPRSTQNAWGFPFVEPSVRRWRAEVPVDTLASLARDPDFSALLREASAT